MLLHVKGTVLYQAARLGPQRLVGLREDQSKAVAAHLSSRDSISGSTLQHND